ncbi:MAG: NADH-ubiquinone oxidoreductase-F iron-sulfur binding region domain-containing protein [Acidimicrobiales bacterium]
MTNTLPTTEAPAALDPGALTRLFPSTTGLSLDDHLAHYGLLPRGTATLIDSVEQAGLRGRGGAGFPTAVKLRAVAGRRRRSVVVANGTEGEPASGKDKALLVYAPHLVLDGATVAAETVGAREIVLCVERNRPATLAAVTAAVADRRARGLDRVPVRIEVAPDRYVAGEESALIHWLNGGEAKPTFVPPRPYEKGVGGRPTLVDNVETLAHIGLIARFGPAWFRAVGTDADPGTTLLTLGGAVGRPGVYEVAGGSSLRSVLESSGTDLAGIQALLVGGYFGTWIPVAHIDHLTLGADSLRSAGASLGCGIVVALPDDACGLAESARVARWLDGENAGQCGPCVHGLGALATTMEALVQGGWGSDAARDRVPALLDLIRGRGACRHPDGAVRFVQSSVRVFAAEIEHHAHRGPCGAPVGLLPTPTPGAWR